jgi:hypothetical protein
MASIKTYVKWLYSSGQIGFVEDAEWIRELRKQRISCSHCDALRPEARHSISTMYLSSVPRRKIPVGRVLLGGVMIHRSLLEIIGVDRFRDTCRYLPVRQYHTSKDSDFVCLIDNKRRGAFRGDFSSRIGLCEVCGRLLYWPCGVRYLLRNNWDGTGGITVMGSDLICTPEYYEEVLKPHKPPLLRAENCLLIDTDDPPDGLPVNFDEMIERIRELGWTR